MRRVLYVHHAADLGGASLSMLDVIGALDRARYAPEVLFNCVPGSVRAPFEERDIPIFVDPSISCFPHAQGAWLSLRSLRPWEIVTRALAVWPSARRFRKFLQEHPCDLVHLNSIVQIPAAIGARQAGVPVVWHIREELHPGYIGLRRAWVRRCVDRCADGVIAISRYNAAQLTPNSRISVVYNFLDFERFDRKLSGAAFRRQLGIAEDVPLVLMLGGVVHSKGADVLLTAAVRVHESRPDIVFVIAGLPPGEESPRFLKRILRRLAERTGLIPSVERRVQSLIHRQGWKGETRFVGLRRDVAEMLAACAVLVWPATVSHFARPIIEAGAMERPVVASDFPSSREIVLDETTGILVPARDPAALAGAILRLIERPDEARRMGEAAYALARERYDARRNAAAIVTLYDAILDGASGEPGR